MDKKEIKIGLALSGGGMRATLFHLGILKWLAEMELLENIEHISTVSGGSICAGLLYSSNNMKWPSSKEYLEKVLPEIKKKILDKDVTFGAFGKTLEGWDIKKLFESKAESLAKTMKKYWKMDGIIKELSERPIWYINCTTFETGKCFRFSQKRCGDYKIGYFDDGNFPIAEAVAASAGFPILIGMTEIKTDKYIWKNYEGEEPKLPADKIHLWDGGVYDNLGIEALYRPDNGGECRKGINFCIVSDASAGTEEFTKPSKNLLGKLADIKRLVDIDMDQVAGLRLRNFVDFIINKKSGMCVKIGNSAEKITTRGVIDEKIKDELLKECLGKEESEKLKNYPTTLFKPSEKDFDLIVRHGYENAKCVYYSYESTLK